MHSQASTLFEVNNNVCETANGSMLKLPIQNGAAVLMAINLGNGTVPWTKALPSRTWGSHPRQHRSLPRNVRRGDLRPYHNDWSTTVIDAGAGRDQW